MKLSMSNGTFLEKPLSENIAAVKDLGFGNLEFNMKCVEKGDDDAVYPARELIQENGLKCLTLHGASLHVENEAQVPTAIYYGRVSVDFASKFQAPAMVVHSNISWQLPADLRSKVLSLVFGELCPLAKRHGIRLALENLSVESTGYGKNVPQLEEILGVIDDGDMGFTLDFCHAEAMGQTESLLEKYQSCLANIHLSNLQHTPFMEETPRLAWFIAKLKDYSYDGPVTLELSRKCTLAEIQRTKAVVQRLIEA